jgi:hypothetical protein
LATWSKHEKNDGYEIARCLTPYPNRDTTDSPAGQRVDKIDRINRIRIRFFILSILLILSKK